MKIVAGNDEFIASWAGARLGIADFGPSTTMAIIDSGGRLVGACIFNNYRHPNIEASIVTEDRRWCSRSILGAIFAYPFRQLGCTRLTAITEIMNQPARAFLCRLGFQEEGILRKAFPGGIDAVVHGMLAEECRWLLPAEEPISCVAAE